MRRPQWSNSKRTTTRRSGEEITSQETDPSTSDQGIKRMFLFDGKVLTANVAVIETSDSMGSLLSVECLIGVGDALVWEGTTTLYM